MRLCLLLLLLLLQSPGTSAGFWSWLWSSGSEKAKAAPHLSCKDENNNNVQWYILYKAPGGQQYIYISTNGKENTNKNIGNPHGVLGQTLSPMFDNNMPKSFGFLSYNDQPPPDRKSAGQRYGHSKGVVLWDSETKTALWITHSTPRFPYNRIQSSFWPETANRNGQIFMCVTVQYNQLQVIGTHLQYIRAYTFDRYNPDSAPEMIRKVADNIGEAPQETKVQNLKVGNMELNVVAKKLGQTAADGDLYVQLSREMKSDLNAKTWGCQYKQDKSYCESNQHKVMSVIEVKTDLGKWSWGSDHSKWAVTPKDLHWTCIADMNRAPSQYMRPGGALCIQNEKVSDLFRGFVVKLLLCGEDPSRIRPRDCSDDPDVDILSDGIQEMDLNQHKEL